MIPEKKQRQQAQEALAAFHRLYNSHSHMLIYSQHKPEWDQQQARAREFQALDALFLFADLVYGEPQVDQSNLLCDACHMARSLAHLRDDRNVPLFLCASCYQQYQQQQVAAQAEPNEPATQEEVTS